MPEYRTINDYNQDEWEEHNPEQRTTPKKQSADGYVRISDYDQEEWSDYDPYAVSESTEPEEESWNATRGLKSGLWQTAATPLALGSMLGKAAHQEEPARILAEKARGLYDKAEQYQPDTSFKELVTDPSFEGAVDWAMYTIFNFAPSMVAGFTGAAVGAKVAMRVFFKNAIKKGIAKGLTKEAATKAITKQVMNKIAKRGAATGLVTSTAGLETAPMYMEDVRRHGVEGARVLPHLVTGGLAGLVELGLAGFGSGHYRLIKKFYGEAGEELAKKSPNAAMRMIKEIFRQSGGEAGQELTQEELAIANELWTSTPEERGTFEYFGVENLLRRGEAFAGGGLVGIPGGGVSGMIPSRNIQNTAENELSDEQTYSKNRDVFIDKTKQGLADGSIDINEVKLAKEQHDSSENPDPKVSAALDEIIKDYDEVASPEGMFDVGNEAFSALQNFKKDVQGVDAKSAIEIKDQFLKDFPWLEDQANEAIIDAEPKMPEVLELEKPVVEPKPVVVPEVAKPEKVEGAKPDKAVEAEKSELSKDDKAMRDMLKPGTGEFLRKNGLIGKPELFKEGKTKEPIKVYHQSDTGELKIGKDVYGLGEGYFVSKKRLPKGFYGDKDVSFTLDADINLFDFQKWAKENKISLRTNEAQRKAIFQEAHEIAREQGYDGIEFLPDDIWIFDKNKIKSTPSPEGTKVASEGVGVEKAILSDAPFKKGEVETGKPVKFHYLHNKEQSPSLGSEFAQDIEPHGKYVASASTVKPSKAVQEMFDFGVADLKNPLVLEHKTSRHGGWKTDLSKMYGGKTGKELSKAVIGDGYDGIVTVDKGRISESVILSTKAKAKKPKVSTKGQNIRTLRGAVRNIGKINPLNYKGEVREFSVGIKRSMFKKSGVPIDDAVRQLREDGWLDKDATVSSFLEELRINPDIVKRDRLARDISEKKPHEKTDAEKKLEKEMAREPEAPPEGEYKTVTVDDLKEGETYTVIENRTSDGWDEYKVHKTKEGVTLEDGVTLKLEPWDEVQVLKKDLAKESKKLPIEKAKPKGPFKPDLKTMPLDEVTVKTKALREKTGETVVVEENAKQAIERIDKEIESYYEILACL